MMDERTLKAMQGFKELFDSGKSVAEIAKMFQLSSSTLYKRLDEIAAMEHCSRDDLLKRPGAGNPYGSAGRYAAKLPIIDPEETAQAFKEVSAACAKLRRNIQLQINKLEG